MDVTRFGRAADQYVSDCAHGCFRAGSPMSGAANIPGAASAIVVQRDIDGLSRASTFHSAVAPTVLCLRPSLGPPRNDLANIVFSVSVFPIVPGFLLRPIAIIPMITPLLLRCGLPGIATLPPDGHQRQ
jgi:hypothetical protein